MKRTINTIIFAVIISAFGIGTFAQNTMNEDFRKTAPASLAPKQFDIPKPFETVLPNGLKVVVFEDKRLPLVSYRLAFKTGTIYDPKDSVGLTAALTAMLNEGTKTRASKQLAEEIERLGASVAASASEDNTIVSASALSLYGSDVLRLMTDMVLNPMFPESELALYKKNTIENLKYQRSQPAFLADEQIAKTLYGTHPYSIVSPSAVEVEKLSREKLAAFHAKMFTPNNATLIVVGDVNRENLLKEIKENFGGWGKGAMEEMKFSTPPVRTATTLTVVDRPGSIQSNIVLANLAIDRSNPDYFPVLVMNQILGAGPSARLFMNLREAKGYTYGAYSRFDTKRLAGNFETNAEVRTPVTGDSLKEFFYELNRVRNEKASDKELKDAKSFLTGIFPLRAETQEGLTNLLVSQQLYDLPADYLQTYRDKVNAVTLEDVERVAKKYISPDKIAIVIVGDAEEILPQIKTYSKKIEVFDAEGKPLDIAKFGKTATGAMANVNGKWNLNIDAQGQKIPVTLVLKQDGAKVSGSLDSMLGKGEIADAKVSGNKFIGTTKTQIQGQAVELNINGTIEGNSMKGVINSSAPGFPPLPFEGTRESGTTVEGKPMSKTEVSTTKNSSGNITGKWKVNTDVNSQAVSVDVDFKQDAGKLSGTLSSAFGSGNITEGTLSGKKVKAKFMMDFQGEPLEVLLDGNLDGDGKMSGTLTPQGGGIGALAFTATKVN
ncbi:MAG: insulinase family protein [Acidobacteria bacterium]|nr:insulinase family protein [Acidobacteriota bacterium]